MDTKSARIACEHIEDLIRVAAERVRQGDDLHLTLIAFGIGAFDRGERRAHEKRTIPQTRPVKKLEFGAYADVVHAGQIRPGMPPEGAFHETPTKRSPRPKPAK